MTPAQTLDWLADQHFDQCKEVRPVQDWIRKMKSQLPAPVQEPVAHFGSAYVNENGVHVTTVLGPVAIPQDAKLYTHPQPKREPLTDKDFLDWYDSAIWGNEDFKECCRIAFEAGWQAAHGIKEKNT